MRVLEVYEPENVEHRLYGLRKAGLDNVDRSGIDPSRDRFSLGRGFLHAHDFSMFCCWLFAGWPVFRCEFELVRDDLMTGIKLHVVVRAVAALNLAAMKNAVMLDENSIVGSVFVVKFLDSAIWILQRSRDGHEFPLSVRSLHAFSDAKLGAPAE
jgi:hypothetical protein